VQQQGCVFKTVSMKVAAKRCDLRMLQYLYDANCEWKPTVATEAARYGHLDVIVWAQEREFQIDFEAMSAVAAECGYLNILKLALQHIEQPQLTELLNIAGRKGEPIVAKWLKIARC
jgi:hypothetical protein